jgi:pyruvate kinase
MPQAMRDPTHSRFVPRTRKVRLLATLGPASRSREMILRLVEAGADAYLSKPHHLAELDRLMMEHLARA